MTPPNKPDYRMQVVQGLHSVPAAQWNALLPVTPGSNPFLRHEYLYGLEKSGCVGEQTGWLPQHLLLRDEHNLLIGAAPLYLKTHSYGEYVFDWSWADAYRHNGLRYYPKLLSAVPFSPITGPRLLAHGQSVKDALVTGMLELVHRLKLSSVHLLYPERSDWAAIESHRLLRRTGVQFHWHNQNYASFDAFLESLTQPKRKKIRAERRKVAQAGVQVQRLQAHEISADDWSFFNRCYEATYLAHQSTPYLTEEFFQGLGATLSNNCILVIARRAGQPIASSLLLRDNERIYGRYWGALEYVPCLHFELAFYQSIEAAIELNLRVVEGGAQGEHKLARGFEPVQTESAHWLSEPAFFDAVDRFLARERTAIDGYLDDLNAHSAFKREL